MDNQIITKLNNFFQQFQQNKYKKGNVIIRADENPKQVYYLADGYVRMYSVSDEGVELTLNIFKPGSYFPMTVAIGESVNFYTFETMSDSIIWTAPKEQVVGFLKVQPDVLYELTKRIVVGLNGTLVRMQYLLSGDAGNKIAASLYLLTKRFSVNKENKYRIQIPLTHQDIAQLSGLTRETTSIEMKNLEKMGVIHYKGQQITVDNINKLESLSLIYQDEKPLPYTF